MDLGEKMGQILKKTEKKLGQKQLVEMAYKCWKQTDMLSLFLNTLVMRKVVSEEEIVKSKKA